MFYTKININGTEYPLAVTITGNGAPTISTAAAVGMLYMDVSTGTLYKCTAVSGSEYTWRVAVPEVVHTGGDSGLLVMSQLGVKLEFDKLGRVPIMSRNLFNPATVTEGGWMDPETGVIKLYKDTQSDAVRYMAFSDYIPVEGGESYMYSTNNPGSDMTHLHSCVFLDAKRAYVSGHTLVYSNTSPVRLNAPPTAAYVVVNINTSIAWDRTQIEKGTVKTEYVPYGETDQYYLDHVLVRAEQIVGDNVTIVQEAGNSETAVMSQKAVVDYVNARIAELTSGL